MRKRDITRISYKMNDLKEYEARRPRKAKEPAEPAISMTCYGTKVRAEINRRIGMMESPTAETSNVYPPLQ